MALRDAGPAKNVQAGTGTASTTAATLVNAVNNRDAAHGIEIKNNDATNDIFVGGSNVSATQGYRLQQGESVLLNIQDPWNVYVVASAATPEYSWIAH